MKNIDELNLQNNEKTALQELKKLLQARFRDVELIIFGSKARGDYDKESDIDLLIIIGEKLKTPVEEEIVKLAYDIELRYDVVFGLLIESKIDWDTEIARAMPIHWNVDRDGVLV